MVLEQGNDHGDRGRICRHRSWVLGHDKVEETTTESKFMEDNRVEEGDWKVKAGNESHSE